MQPSLVLIGGDTVVDVKRILAVVGATKESLPIKKYKQAMADKNLVVDVTRGKRVKSFILLDSNHIFLSCISADTLQLRIEAIKNGHVTKKDLHKKE